MTAGVWIRGILADHYGVPIDSVEYFIGARRRTGTSRKVTSAFAQKYTSYAHRSDADAVFDVGKWRD